MVNIVRKSCESKITTAVIISILFSLNWIVLENDSIRQRRQQGRGSLLLQAVLLSGSPLPACSCVEGGEKEVREGSNRIKERRMRRVVKRRRKERRESGK